MDIYETIDKIKTGLIAGSDVDTDLLYGVNVLVDPYDVLDKKVPFVLLEAEKTKFKNAEKGPVVAQTHIITISCVVTAQKITFTTFKPAAISLMKKTIEKLDTLIDGRYIQALKVTEGSYDEMMIGSLMCSGAPLIAEVDTRWKDL